MNVKGKVVPLAFVAALTGPLALLELERWEGNILTVYADNLAGGLPTWCAGRTGWDAKIGTKLASDECQAVNKGTLVEYGASVLSCTTWQHLDADRLIGLTLFAVNVGKAGACGSQAVKAINGGRVSDGCNLIARTPAGRPNWSNAGGRYVQGLQNRRQAERALCRKGLSA
jgi:GH24 family phage-related lysozyme (muramidase)